jgi:hypothetical protein
MSELKVGQIVKVRATKALCKIDSIDERYGYTLSLICGMYTNDWYKRNELDADLDRFMEECNDAVRSANYRKEQCEKAIASNKLLEAKFKVGDLVIAFSRSVYRVIEVNIESKRYRLYDNNGDSCWDHEKHIQPFSPELIAELASQIPMPKVQS